MKYYVIIVMSSRVDRSIGFDQMSDRDCEAENLWNNREEPLTKVLWANVDCDGNLTVGNYSWE